MNTTQRHYETLLGEVYSWSVGVRGDPFERAAEWLARFKLDGAATSLDLGAGFGAHVVPLARAGSSVTAVDFDRTLLSQLQSTLGGLVKHVSVHQADLVDFVRAAKEQRWDLILCAGDTITHLPELSAVRELISLCAQHLRAGGALALQFRDSTGLALEGTSRFLEVARTLGGRCTASSSPSTTSTCE